ncbi:MAG TPA: STAS/SEC14 domain-containing protein, partial [Puia sp.]
MIEVIPDIPPNVAGFKATGDVTREDYEKVVFPEIRRHIAAYGHLNFVFYVDTPLKNFSPAAWVRDIWMSLRDLGRWHKVAIVSEKERIRQFTDTISFLLPGEYRGFPVQQLEEAIRWASTDENEAPSKEVPDYIEALLPKQVRGASTQTATEVVANREEDAQHIFERAVERLLDVNQWTDMCGYLAAGFCLTDDRGEELQGHANVEDFIRIDVPGPGPREGRGYDWVKIERVERPVVAGVDGLFLIQVRPSPAPSDGTGFGGFGTSAASGPPAHFLEDSATSTFILER